MALRFLLRTDMRADFNSEQDVTNFTARPAVLALSFDMGSKFSFFGRYRFDFPTTLQLDGTPESLIAFNVQYKPTDRWRFVIGKQTMLYGSYEFDYSPINVFYYSMLGNHLQSFVTGAAAHYMAGKQELAVQVSKVTDGDFVWNDNPTGWNTTLYYAGNIGNGFYKPLWSYTYTFAGNGKHLHNFMLGNRFDMGRVTLELDAMAQSSFRYYSAADGVSPDCQKRTKEMTLLGFMNY